MAKEICISSTPHETRLAILEDDQLAEIYYERENEYTLAGSIYKGRVTRVLPGMQSAFVDIGLERDAFLYVTDFLEMEDQEDSDEVERAAVQGSTQRQPQGRSGRGEDRGRRGESRGESRPSNVSEPEATTYEGGDATLHFAPTTSEILIEGGETEPVESAPVSEEMEQGARRWRGRRRRRGGRGRDEAEARTEGQSASSEPEVDAEEAELPAVEIEAAAHEAVPESKPAAATPFLLPGESLSKYGSTNGGGDAPKAGGLTITEVPSSPVESTPLRTVSKPSTLVEGEIVWDGLGLLPGESLARHRQVENAPVFAEPSAAVDAEPSGEFALPAHGGEEHVPEHSHGTFEFSEISGTVHELVHEEVFDEVEHEAGAPEAHAEVPVEETVEEIHDTPVTEVVEEVCEAPEAHEVHEEHAEVAHAANETTEGEEFEEEEIHDASASHNVDPLPPSEFRFSDLFGGRKKSDEPEYGHEPMAEQPAPKPAVAVSVSAYAPGDGLVEEEVIEEEEYEFSPLKAHHGDEHDLDELEEETLQQQIRSGALGEMLEEAQLDHRLQVESVEEEEGEEGEEAAVAAPSRPGQQGGRERGDRGRGRRGRGGDGRSGDGRGEGRRGPSRRSAQTTDLPIISDLLKPGQEILVQIAKEPIAKKGARITSHIALPGRFLVFMPTVSHVGVSRKIASDDERQRLKRILISERGEASGGFIVRTAAEGATEDELRADLRFLINLWNEIKQRAENSRPPALIYHDLSLIERILRDQVSDNFSHIWVDSEADYERIVRFLNRFSPELVRRVKLYTKEVPLFEHFGIQDEISKALRSKVWLKSGGSIVINQTEALVAIDINTGKFVGKTARLEDTILKTNLDAIPEIVRQIRLRDLGGIIVIDFIDMDERKNRARVMAALEEALKQDRAPTKVLQFNDFGLVAITRKRVKQSLERTLSVPCPICQATGMVKSPATVANEIYVEVRKMRKHFDQNEVLLRVNPETAKALKANNAKWLTELEELAGKNVLVKSDATLHPEQFDIQG
ncbi:Rne/Rng family ribonuclease [Acidicapsa dinghuensis]|uniref:Rne/Rng family ribonuclease n=1 Tax=Acidicapsa dinghuensis TaxID=2218256 RepID=A0ABW1EJB8_9BACT|nr:Rne/Rng family ribonuclease [Acidicapsa dinghuensis]